MKSIMIAPLALVASLAVASAMPASAQTVTERVPYTDLDLRNDSGVSTLTTRVNGAVKRVCTTDGVLTPQVMQCRMKSRTDARRQMKVAIAQANGEIQLASR